MAVESLLRHRQSLGPWICCRGREPLDMGDYVEVNPNPDCSAPIGGVVVAAAALVAVRL